MKNAVIAVLVLFGSMLAASPLVLAPQDTSADACICDTELVVFTASNPGTTQDNYSFSIISTVPWGVVAPSLATIGGQGSLPLYAYLTPSCFATPGNYDFTLKGQSSDYTANAHVALHVTPCVTLQDVSTESKTMCLGETHTYKVLLRNKSRTAGKNYTIILTGDAAPAATAPQKVYVPAVGETTFDIPFDSAKLSGTGTKTLNVRAVSIYEITGQPTNDEGSLSMQFITNNCQTLDFNFPNLNGNVIEKCAETPFSTPMVVTNAGPLSDTVTLYTNASSATLPRTLELASGGTQQTQLTIAANTGSFTLKVSAVSKYGAVREKTLEVVSKTCFGVDVKVMLPNNTCSDTEHAFPVLVKNTGSAAGLFNLSVENMDFVALQPAQVFLNPGEEKEVKFLVSSSMNDGKYEPIISARSDMSYGENKTYLYLERCYGVRLTGENDWICQCSDKAFPFNVMNIGTQSDSYTLSRIDGPDWIQQDLLNGSVLNIEGNSRRTVNPVAFTCEADPLRYQFTFAVSSISRNVSDKLCVNITVYSKAVCYVARVAGPDTETIEECTSTIIPVTIQNTGMLKNAYALDVEGPTWVNVTPDFVFLEKAGAQVVYLSASPPLNEAGNSYKIKIIATAKGVVSTKEITLNVVGQGEKASPTPKLGAMPLDVSYAAGNLVFKCADGALVSVKSPSNKTSAATCVNGSATLGAGEYGVYSIAVTKQGYVPITTTYEAKKPSSQSGMFLASTTALWIAGALLVALVAYGVYSVMQKRGGKK
ncbi:hypothetical protein COU36_03900 [Candidatus Micrarchaeota archaeon CG10_big_fil_rev_8_21_14_0_10_59_7]|nr:MAG: hypothetical protein COU36_03900 [Candidatus Micrarchaeota archaeon CG10_big_fil_rev_8_21_14_0_10_59_7]